MRFLGKHQATLDAKYRVAVPARMRERVDERERDRFILTVLPDGCLVLYPLSEWERIASQIEERAQSALGWQAARALERELFANAVDVSCDRQGRILIPEDLRRRARMEREVVFVGVRNRIELWDREVWEASDDERAKAFEEAAREVLR